MHVNPLGVEMFLRRQFEQRLEYATPALGRAGLTRDAEAIAAARDFDVETTFDLAQVFIELTAEVGEAVIVGGLEDDVPGDL